MADIGDTDMVEKQVEKNRWLYKFSVLDYEDFGQVENVFKIVYDYYIPENAKVLDLTCGQKLMYRGYDYPNVEFNDIDPEIESDYHFDCRDIADHLDKKYDWFIYDPPYVDIKGRKDKREEDYGYKLSSGIAQLRDTTLDTKSSILEMINPKGGVIAKITDFHWNGKLRGHHDIIDWFYPEFFLWDLRVYRWYRRAVNINWYKLRAFKTHSYFLVFHLA